MLDAVLRVCHLSLTTIRLKNPSAFTSYHTLQLLYYLIVLYEHCQCIIEYMYCLWYIITFTLELRQGFSQMVSTLMKRLRLLFKHVLRKLISFSNYILLKVGEYIFITFEKIKCRRVLDF